MTEGKKQSIRMEISRLNTNKNRCLMMSANSVGETSAKHRSDANELEIEIRTLERLVR